MDNSAIIICICCYCKNVNGSMLLADCYLISAQHQHYPIIRLVLVLFSINRWGWYIQYCWVISDIIVCRYRQKHFSNCNVYLFQCANLQCMMKENVHSKYPPFHNYILLYRKYRKPEQNKILNRYQQCSFYLDENGYWLLFLSSLKNISK